MSKNHGLTLFVVLLGLLTGIVWYHTGSPMPPSGQDEIWYHAGLFTLLIGVFIVEYRFTRPNDVFVNCLVVFASTSTLSHPPHEAWWHLLKWSALAFGIVAMLLAWDPGQESKLINSRVRTFVYQIVTRLGSGEVIFSLVFILALLSYFEFDSVDTKLFVIIWGIFLLAAHIDFADLGKIVLHPSKFRNRRIFGVAHSFLAPSIVYCKKFGSAHAELYEVVGFSQSAGANCHCFGIVIGERSSVAENRIVVALLNKTVSEANLNDRSFVVSTTEFDADAIEAVVSEEELSNLRHIIGTVTKGTNISRIRFELFGNPKVTAGSLLVVKSTERDAFYQIFDGAIEEEVSIKDSARAYVEGDAEQVGVWDNQRGGFDTHDWVAKERSQVKLIDEQSPIPTYQLKSTEASVGTVPHSNYPVNIDISDLVLYHSAILGVTGSGKSYLTYSLIEECTAKNIKVICIDPTGDYQRHLAGAVILSNPGHAKAFLNSSSYMIGIVETATRRDSNPIVQALKMSELCLTWCREHRTDEEVLNPKPKVLVVLEEAHLLIPEWNSNPHPNMRDQVSAHSQIVLQARKYGLGFLVVSQRTANVTKSILNQCNTIVSFQAFDETGFEFLKNYMGHHHVNSLPNLKARHGLLVGKASLSRRPLMVKFKDQNRQLMTQPAPEMPMPPEAQPGRVASVGPMDLDDNLDGVF